MTLPDAKTIEAYRRDGAVLIKGLWTDWVEVIRDGIARNMAEPGPYAAENLKAGEGGRFFDDYCNWTRTHRNNVANDATNTGCCALIRLNV